MMERKLFDAAAALPCPDTTFEAIVQEASRRNPPKTHRFNPRRAAALAAVLVLVFTFVAAGYRYDQIQRSMWVLYYEHNWDAAQHAIDDFDLTLPEELNGFQFYSQREFSVVPEDTPMTQAMLTNFYRPIEVQYAHFLTLEEMNVILASMEGGGSISGIQEWGPSITVGTTDSPYWAHYFSVSEDGLVRHDAVVPGSTQVITYSGKTIQLYLTKHHYAEGYTVGPYANAFWVDEARGCSILLDLHSGDMAALVDTVKLLIDSNP